MAKLKSGSDWVTWANAHARNSKDVANLADPFRSHVRAFIAALKAAGAVVVVEATKRDAKRAYLFHWCWLIGLGKVRPSEAKPMIGVDIEWDHGDAKKSQAAAHQMIVEFGLAVPPKSEVAPALHSNHIAGHALDMDITWEGTLRVKQHDGKIAAIPYIKLVNNNTALHNVGALYGVIKHIRDAPHWSVNGR